VNEETFPVAIPAPDGWHYWLRNGRWVAMLPRGKHDIVVAGYVYDLAELVWRRVPTVPLR
jgi:hypothetical protein